MKIFLEENDNDTLKYNKKFADIEILSHSAEGNDPTIYTSATYKCRGNMYNYVYRAVMSTGYTYNNEYTEITEDDIDKIEIYVDYNNDKTEVYIDINDILDLIKIGETNGNHVEDTIFITGCIEKYIKESNITI